MTDNQALLADYVETGSENAFRELVERYVDFVFTAAVRLTDGDVHRAEDVAQIVFLDLSRHAPKLSAGVMLGGWLHRHTCFVASNLKRGERRRQARERQAAEMNALEKHADDGLAQVTPVLDEAVNQLQAEDRDAILLRFFERLDFRSVGKALGSSEEAAKKRVTRALDKLHDLLVARGVTLTGAALASVLTAGAVKAAPAGLVATISWKALAGTLEAASLVKGTGVTALKIMTATKISIGLAGAVLVAGIALSVRQNQSLVTLRAENAALHQQLEQLSSEAQEASNRLAQLQGDRGVSEDRLGELMRLRSEVAGLKRQLADAAKATPGTGARSPQEATAPSEQDQQQVASRRMRDAKIWVMAFHQYAGDHQKLYPANFDAVASYLAGTLKSDANPGEAQRELKDFIQTTNNFELVFQGSLNEITNWSSAIVMREKEAWPAVQGGWFRTYGFADGHTELHQSDDGNFVPWESERMPGHSGR